MSSKRFGMIVAVAFVLTMLLVCLVPMMESYHECEGEDCPICHLFFVFSNVMAALKLALPVCLAILLFAAIVIIAKHCGLLYPASTLINDKTKLSN